jgi:hypothetical protein
MFSAGRREARSLPAHEKGRSPASTSDRPPNPASCYASQYDWEPRGTAHNCPSGFAYDYLVSTKHRFNSTKCYADRPARICSRLGRATHRVSLGLMPLNKKPNRRYAAHNRARRGSAARFPKATDPTKGVVSMSNHGLDFEPMLFVRQQPDGRYAIEAQLPGSRATIITQFDSEAEAAAWLKGYEERRKTD